MLLPLSRPVPPAIASNGLGELLAELVEPQFRIGQLAIDESQSLDAHSDMRGGSLNGSLSDAECRLAQFAQHLGHVETAYFFNTRAIAALDAREAFSGVGAASHRSSIQSLSRSPSCSICG